MKKQIRLGTALIVLLLLASCNSLPEKELTKTSLPETSVSGDASDSSAAAEIAETPLYEDNGLKITAKRMTYDSLDGAGLVLSFENTAGRKLGISTDTLSVNGFMMPELFSYTIGDGETGEATLLFPARSLGDADIAEISAIAVSFSVYDPESYEVLFVTESLSLKTDAPDTSGEKPEGVLLTEKDGVSISFLFTEKTDTGEDLVLLLENGSQKDLSLLCESVSVGEVRLPTLCSVRLTPGAAAVTRISFDADTLRDKQISSLANASLSFEGIDSESFVTLFTTGTLSVGTKAE